MIYWENTIFPCLLKLIQFVIYFVCLLKKIYTIFINQINSTTWFSPQMVISITLISFPKLLLLFWTKLLAGFISFHTKSKTFGLYQWSHHVILYLMTWPSWLLLYICVSNSFFFVSISHLLTPIKSNQLNLGQVFFISLEKISFYPQFSMFFFFLSSSFCIIFSMFLHWKFGIIFSSFLQ